MVVLLQTHLNTQFFFLFLSNSSSHCTSEDPQPKSSHTKWQPSLMGHEVFPLRHLPSLTTIQFPNMATSTLFFLVILWIFWKFSKQILCWSARPLFFLLPFGKISNQTQKSPFSLFGLWQILWITNGNAKKGGFHFCFFSAQEKRILCRLEIYYLFLFFTQWGYLI